MLFPSKLILVVPILLAFEGKVNAVQPSSFVISNLKRTWNFGLNTPEESISLAFQSSGTKGDSGTLESFIWSIPQPHAILISDLTYSFKAGSGSSSDNDDSNSDDSSSKGGRTEPQRPKIVPCNKAFGWTESLASQTTCYKIPLLKGLSAGSEEKVIIYLKATYMPIGEPFPSKVQQNENQYLRFGFPIPVLSQYRILKQRTITKFGSSNIKNIVDSGYGHEKKGSSLQFGPMEKPIEPFTVAWGNVQVEHNSPYLLVLSLNRTMYLSHWADDILIEESYDVRHEGARLKKPFSRIEYQRGRQQSSYGGKMGGAVPSIFMSLPKDASGISYVDEVGNVSTSRIIWETGNPILNLQPRYPLFGGWNYTWTQTFHVPLSNYLEVVAGKGFKLANIPLVSLFQGVPVDRLQVTIVFPEGAASPDFSVPFSPDSVEHGNLFTYLDTSGRPTITLIKHHVTTPLIEPFEVTYNLSSMQMAQKPIILIGSFFIMFLIFIVFARIDFSIHGAQESSGSTMSSGTSTKKKSD